MEVTEALLDAIDAHVRDSSAATKEAEASEWLEVGGGTQ